VTFHIIQENPLAQNQSALNFNMPEHVHLGSLFFLSDIVLISASQRNHKDAF